MRPSRSAIPHPVSTDRIIRDVKLLKHLVLEKGHLEVGRRFRGELVLGSSSLRSDELNLSTPASSISTFVRDTGLTATVSGSGALASAAA